MKRLYGVLVLIVLVAGLLGVLRGREGWINRVMQENRAGRLESAAPRWPDLSREPYANQSIERSADD
jgi:hypothetical protein